MIENLIELMEQNNIYHMDCIAGMSLIPDKKIDMILTDLPYGITDCSWDSLLPMGDLWLQYERIIKPNGAIVLTASQPFTTTLIQSNRKLFRYCWYWHKNMSTGFPFAKFQPLRCMEDVVVFYKKAPTYNPQGLVALENAKSERKRTGADCIYKMDTLSKEYTPQFTNYPKNLLEVKCERGLHPTQKPVALFEYLIRTYTDEGDLVLDSCIGSGTTAVACINTNRSFIGFEIGKNHFNTALRRIKEAQACLTNTQNQP